MLKIERIFVLGVHRKQHWFGGGETPAVRC